MQNSILITLHKHMYVIVRLLCDVFFNHTSLILKIGHQLDLPRRSDTHTHTRLLHAIIFFRGGKPSTQPPPLNLQGLWGSVPAGLLELAADRGSCKEKTARCDQRCYEDAFPGISHVLKMHLFLLDYFL